MFLLCSRLSLLVVVAITVNGCKPKQLIVPASDPTPPNALWLQIDRPGQPLLNAYITSADLPAHAAAGQQLRITARADDPDGGVKDVQIWLTEQTWRTNPDGTETTTGPGLAGAPVASAPSQANVGDPAPASSSITHSLTTALNPPTTRRQYVIWGRAVNFQSGAVETQKLTITVS
jgi:hypothetical protein